MADRPRATDRFSGRARLLARSDVDRLSRVLARAFRDDPFHRWIFPSERDWERRSHWSFAVNLRWALRYGEVLTTDGLDGAAQWQPPRREPPGGVERVRLVLPMIRVLGRRVFAVGAGIQKLESLHPREPHWYLAVLGTDPTHQGRGIGSALMAPVLSRCDAEGVSAYLEASRIENVPYYERHGFELVGETSMPDGGPTAYRMLRKPRK